MNAVRKLTITGKTTYYVTIPQKMIRELGWRKGQKKVITKRKDKIIIEDWKP